MFKWDRVVLHHTAGHDNWAAVDMVGIRNYHMGPPPDGRGWSDIGYHAVCEKVGPAYVVLMARPWYRTGSHVYMNNTGSLGLALVGDFVDEPPPDEQVFRAAEWCASMCRSLGIRSSEIYGHNEFRPTTCPGLVPVADIGAMVVKLRTGRYPRAEDL